MTGEVDVVFDSMCPFVFAIFVGELLTSGKGAAPSSWLPRFLLAISQGWLQYVAIPDRLGGLRCSS